MTWLVTADLHLDNKPQHAYRWGIFDWLAEQKQKYNAAGILILGDITDEKDNHSAALVNGMVSGLKRLGSDVLILKGNHDFIDPMNPFFGFLSHIDGLQFVTEPLWLDDKYFIPHQPNQKAFDQACLHPAIVSYEPSLILLHGCFDGAISETGHRMSGLSTALLEKNYKGLVLAGDIHKPQQVGCVTYVGAPFRVRFGDDFTPRVALVGDNNVLSDLHYPCPRKHRIVIRDNRMGCESAPDGPNAGDHIKLIIELPQEETVNWEKHKKLWLGVCREMGLEVFGIQLKVPTSDSRALGGGRVPTTGLSPAQIFDGFCKSENIKGAIKEAGKGLLDV